MFDDLLFTRELAAVLIAAPYTALAALFIPAGGTDPLILAAQAAASSGRPLLVIHGEYTVYGIARRKGTLTLDLHSRVGDDTTGQHQARVNAALTALLGDIGANFAAGQASRAAAIAALKAALLARGKVKLTNLGPAPNFLQAGVQDEDLVTTLNLSCAWEFIPQA